jgi:hypothetical protein
MLIFSVLRKEKENHFLIDNFKIAGSLTEYSDLKNLYRVYKAI